MAALGPSDVPRGDRGRANSISLVQSCVDPAAFLDGVLRRYDLVGGTAMALLRDDDLRGQIENLPSAQRVVKNAPPGGAGPGGGRGHADPCRTGHRCG